MGLGSGRELAPAAERPFKAIELIYASATEPSRWPDALQAIADCFDDVGTILIYGRDDGSFGVVESPAITPLLPEYARDWSDRDIRAIRCRERGYFFNRDVVTDRDLLSPEEIETDPFYRFLAGYGLKYFACAMVSPKPHIAVGLSVQRRLGKPEYSEAEIDLLARLSPHVERSLQLSIRLMDAELINAGFADALRRLSIGVFVLDSLSRVVFSNQPADRSIGNSIGIAEQRRYLRLRTSGVKYKRRSNACSATRANG